MLGWAAVDTSDVPVPLPCCWLLTCCCRCGWLAGALEATAAATACTAAVSLPVVYNDPLGGS